MGTILLQSGPRLQFQGPRSQFQNPHHGRGKNKQENKHHLGLYDTTYRPLISESKPVCCITLEPVSLTLRRSVLGSRVSDTKLVSGDTGYPCTKSAVLI